MRTIRSIVCLRNIFICLFISIYMYTKICSFLYSYYFAIGFTNCNIISLAKMQNSLFERLHLVLSIYTYLYIYNIYILYYTVFSCSTVFNFSFKVNLLNSVSFKKILQTTEAISFNSLYIALQYKLMQIVNRNSFKLSVLTNFILN